jgi:DNA (cytosine-5)-methyltransferase 1
VLSYLMHAAEKLRYAWAYRILDSRAFGLPQRRRRFYFLASRIDDPGEVLLARPGGPLPNEQLDLSRPIGFYWTEGRRGKGLTDNALPPLKAGSAIGIPSPPAVLLPDGRITIPTIEDAERVQGFPAGWTEKARWRHRWRLVGNAVSPPVVAWIAERMRMPERWSRSLVDRMPEEPTWPLAGWGDGRGVRYLVNVGEAPDDCHLGKLSEGSYVWSDLSERALRGFIARARDSNLRYPEGFLERLEARLR